MNCLSKVGIRPKSERNIQLEYDVSNVVMWPWSPMWTVMSA